MKLIYFFDKYIKPHTLKGTKICHPADTCIIGDGMSCIREYDVNFWIYTKGDTTIAFDAGHINFKNINQHFVKANIHPYSVKAVFITHADVDHGGGIDKHGNNIFPNADVYLGEMEEAYIKNTTHRFKRFGLKIKNCVQFNDGYRLLKDKEFVCIGDIKIQALHTPGHTLGHTCYLVDDKILITGDCLAVNKHGGYSFFEPFTQYPKTNKKSLVDLKEYVSSKNIELVCTGHSGYFYYNENLFSHINETAKGNKRHPFDETAPEDVFMQP